MKAKVTCNLYVIVFYLLSSTTERIIKSLLSMCLCVCLWT